MGVSSISKYFFLLITILMLSLPALGQRIRTADGKDMGPASDFIGGCVRNLKQGLSGQEIQYNYEGICQCMVDDIMTQLTQKEVKYFYQEGHMEELFTNEKTVPLIVQCLKQNIRVDGNTMVKTPIGKDSISDQILFNGCAEASKDVFKDLVTKDEATKYCQCLNEYVNQGEYTYNDLSSTLGEKSEEIAFIRAKCMISSLYKDESIKSTYPVNVYGSAEQTEVALDENNSVPIRLGSKTYLFAIDSSIVEMRINEKQESELIRLGILHSYNYFGDDILEMRDGSKQSVRVFLIPAVAIGPYVVHDIPLAVVPEGNEVIGTSFLDHFTSWRIDPSKGLLFLKK